MEAITDAYTKAQRHLGRRDAILKKLIRQVGVCTLAPSADHFGMLVRSIVAQQISTKAANAISGRLLTAVGGTLSPAAIRSADEETLRAAGLSEAKRRSLRDLAEKVGTNVVPLAGIGELDDETIIGKLIEVRGIGRWTAQMFLMFSLGRLDVLPVDDFGLRSAVQKQYSLDELPKKAKLTELAEPWQPYRSIGTWYMWRSLGT